MGKGERVGVMSDDLAATLEDLLEAQARLETLIEQSARRRRMRQPSAGAAVGAGPAWLEPLPYLFDRRWSPDIGPSPLSCQWLYGEGPFADADKCGAPTLPGQPYCALHAARSILIRPDADDP